MAPTPTASSLLTISAPEHPLEPVVLTESVLTFVGELEQRFGAKRLALLEARALRQARLDAGELPDFLPETESIRRGTWTVPPPPADLADRRVEITGPVDRKMIINALNSGARVFMADFEDSNTPTWANQLEGQQNLSDAIARTISYTSPEGKSYQLNPAVATLIVRPRGWHLNEKHVLLGGQPISGSLFDFGVYFYRNAKALLAAGSGPYFYLPKLESHHEAALWNEVFVFAQEYLGLPVGTIRATVLIETITAAFEMDEILHVLGPHALGLNCGRWDYIFSYIKKLRRHADRVLPNRGQVTMTSHFLRSYSLLAIKTCHRRGAYAMGGMSAYIPVKADAEANDRAMAAVRADKQREASDGHDGTWVAHPGLVAVALEQFDAYMPGPNNLARTQAEFTCTAEDLLRVPLGEITEAGVESNLKIGIRYMESWLRGVGCVPIHNLMEDAATAEISRAQVWQWLHVPGVQLADGRQFDVALYGQLFASAVAKIRAEVGEAAYAAGQFAPAEKLFDQLIRSDELADFLTLSAYDTLA
jgi:malate synthase